MGPLTDEDEALLDKCGNSIVGGEENKADSKNVEVEEAVDGCEVCVAEAVEECRKDECHDCENNLPGEE